MADPKDAIRGLVKGQTDGTMLKYATEDCMMDPPGDPPVRPALPIAQVNIMMQRFMIAWPDWKIIVHSIDKNSDGSFTVILQNHIGPMKADLPSLGPYPAVPLAVAPEIMKTDVKLPAEVSRMTLNDDGTKVASIKFTGENRIIKDAECLPGIQATWNKKGDFSDVGFGLIYRLLQNAIRGLLDGHTNGTMLEYATAVCMVDPPGNPPVRPALPIAQVKVMMQQFMIAWPDWKIIVHSTVKNPDGSFTVILQNHIGPMKADLPSLGPQFPAVPLAAAPELMKTDVKLPVEECRMTLTDDGIKVASIKFTGEKRIIEGAECLPEIQAKWNMSGAFDDVGFGLIFVLMQPPSEEPSPKRQRK